MAYTKRQQGFRRIVVGEAEFRWNFRTGVPDSRLVVRGPDSAGRRLVVTLRDWQDPWLTISGYRVDGDGLQLFSSARNEPPIVTPAFARQAIEFALEAGWEPLSRAPSFEIEHRAGRFFRR